MTYTEPEKPGIEILPKEYEQDRVRVLSVLKALGVIDENNIVIPTAAPIWIRQKHTNRGAFPDEILIMKGVVENVVLTGWGGSGTEGRVTFKGQRFGAVFSRIIDMGRD